MLLIDEIDRTDEPFEAFLLEALSDFQVTIPELGTIHAPEPPIVILTSNRTREVHDALKRRCLYHWVDYPDFDREIEILQARAPEAAETLSREVVAFVQALRTEDLFKKPGVAETIDWAKCLLALDVISLSPEVIADTLGAVLKYQDDIARLQGSEAKRILDEARSTLWPRLMFLLARNIPGVWGQRPHGCHDRIRPARSAGRPQAHPQHHPFRARAARGGAAHRDGAGDRRGARGGRRRLHLAEDFFYTLRACLVTRPEHLTVFAQVFRLYWRDPRYMEHMMAMMLPAIRGVQEERGAQAAEKRAAEALLDGVDRAPPERERRAGRGDGADRDRRHRHHVARGAAAQARFRADVHRRDGAGQTDAGAAALPVRPLPSRRGIAEPAREPARCAREPARGAARGGEMRRCTTRNRASAGPTSSCLCDISGSMSQYSRMVLHFLHAVANHKGAGWAKVHAFTFGTRLTNITRHLATRDVDAALAAAGRQAQDWEGGTRIGASCTRSTATGRAG